MDIHPACSRRGSSMATDLIERSKVEVIAAIPDKVALAESWGIRFDSKRLGPSGSLPRHAFDRRDEKAGAAIHHEWGNYTDRGSGQRLSLFGLAVALNVYADRGEAIQQLGERYVH
jgi:hypothetical protein